VPSLLQPTHVRLSCTCRQLTVRLRGFDSSGIWITNQIHKQGRRCTYNVTLRRVHETNFAVQKQKVLHISLCVCVLVSGRAQAWTCGCTHVALTVQHAHAPYCHMQPLWLYHIFRLYLIKSTIFGKRLTSIKCVFWFSRQLLSETFLILRRIQRDIVINVKTPSCKVPRSLYTS
jgi:hypothetical protein